MAGGSVPKGLTKGCRLVDPSVIARLEEMVERRTDTALSAQFGISYNTWRKMIAGLPVRASLLDRLQARLDHLPTPPER